MAANAATTTVPARRAPARSAPTRAPTAPRKTAPRRAAPRRPGAKRRRTGHTPIAGFVPVAAARTAGAVGGIADSGIFVWLTRGRLWIGLLGGLLVGIVALNVIALSLSASSSGAANQADELRSVNSTLRAQIAESLSREEVQAAAAELGLIWPAPSVISYVHPGADDAEVAAKRLRHGELAVGDSAPPVDAAPVAPVEVAPVEVAPVETAAVETVPVAEAPVTETAVVAPETPETVPTTASEPATAAPVGGVATP